MSHPINLVIPREEKQSRALLLLRTFFGFFYVLIPHGICLMLYGFWVMIATFIAWFAVLFTGKYPKGLFDSVVGYARWSMRVGAYMMFLTDQYPAFGPGEKETDAVKVTVPYPESLSRGMLLLKTFFGFLYVIIPHGICLMFRMVGVYFVVLIAWFAVLFTGSYPESMHRFVAGTLRWSLRLNMYFIQTDAYPPFSGKE